MTKICKFVRTTVTLVKSMRENQSDSQKRSIVPPITQLKLNFPHRAPRLGIKGSLLFKQYLFILIRFQNQLGMTENGTIGSTINNNKGL